MIDKAEAHRMRDEGMTLQAIGDQLGVSRQRIEQIVGPLNRTGICPCGKSLADRHPNARYCSRSCRNRRNNARQDAKRKSPCVDCGRPSTGERCLHCRRLRWEAERAERWNRLQALWTEGLSMAEIATVLGTTPNALGVELARARAAGWALPLRRANPKTGDLTKDEARSQFAQAMRQGKIRRSERCERCGAVGDIDGHHEDYNRPLYVEWLCRTCHMAHHAEERIAA